MPTYYNYDFSEDPNLIEMNGKLVGNYAILKFELGNNKEGRIFLNFKDSAINAKLGYEHKIYNYNFKPYKISDLIHTNIIKSIDVNFIKFSDVKLLVCESSFDGTIDPDIYIADKEGNILYEIQSHFQIGTRITDVDIKDFNKDGLLDIRIVNKFIVDENLGNIERTILQDKSGYFYSGDLSCGEENKSRYEH